MTESPKVSGIYIDATILECQNESSEGSDGIALLEFVTSADGKLYVTVNSIYAIMDELSIIAKTMKGSTNAG